MNQWWPRIVILGLMAVIVGVPVVLSPSHDGGDAGDQAMRLIIMTPHNEQIRYEFARGFNVWRQARGERAVYFDWRSPGGTSDQRKQLVDVFKAAVKERREEEGIGFDIFFGGGEFEHNLLAAGVKVWRDGREVTIPISIPVKLPDGMLEQVFASSHIGSERLYHQQLRWMGAALSSFGIVYNNDVLTELGLPQPRTWADLTDGRYQRWIALADPAHSGSIAATYNAILRRLGWREGWWMLRRVFANARYFTASSSKVPVDVSAGEAAVGMCIDFYGRFQAGAIGGDRVGYVDPAYMTAITSDPISVLRGAPHEALAHEFVTWVLSRDGQSLWQRRRGTVGGPDRFELRRLPIRRDVYNESEMVSWADDVHPFDIAKSFPPGMPDFYYPVAPVSHAIAIDIHGDLSRAWAVILRTADDDPAKQRMLELFDAMPDDLCVPWPSERLQSKWADILNDTQHADHKIVVTTLTQFARDMKARVRDKDRVVADRLRWTLFFRDNYRQIVDLGR